jgi:hypothetical protein
MLNVNFLETEIQADFAVIGYSATETPRSGD